MEMAKARERMEREMKARGKGWGICRRMATKAAAEESRVSKIGHHKLTVGKYSWSKIPNRKGIR